MNLPSILTPPTRSVQVSHTDDRPSALENDMLYMSLYLVNIYIL